MIQNVRRTALIKGWLGAALLVLVAPMAMAQTNFQTNNSLSNQELEELHDFAADHLDTVQPISIKEGVEYCGFFGYDANGQLAATPAKRGRQDSCQPTTEPDGFTVLASYHTHGSYTMEADTEVPSTDDLLADIAEQSYGYIATPGGRVWFNDWETEESLMLFGPRSIASAPNFRECSAFRPDIQYTLSGLRRRVANDTGEC